MKKKLVTIEVPEETCNEVRDRNGFDWNLREVVSRAFLDAVTEASEEQAPVVYVGMTYVYTGNKNKPNAYKVVGFHPNGSRQVLIERLNDNINGDAGTRIYTNTEKLRLDIQSGRAVVLTDEEFDEAAASVGKVTPREGIELCRKALERNQRH